MIVHDLDAMSKKPENATDLTPEARRALRRIVDHLQALDALPEEDERKIRWIFLGLIDALRAGVRLGHSEAIAQTAEQLRIVAPHVQLQATLHDDAGAQGFLERKVALLKQE